MSLSLHRIVGAFHTEANIVSGISKLEKYSLIDSSKALSVREITKSNNVFKINGRDTLTLSNELAMGYTRVLRDIYYIDNNIPRALELRAIEDVKQLPSYVVGENLRFIEEKLKPELATKLTSKTKTIMSSTNLNDKITEEIVEKNPALKNIFSNLSGKTVKTLTGTVVTFGLGITAVCAIINEHRNRLTACMLYYYQNNQLKRCVIATCTCKQIACNQNCNYCSPDTISKYLPDDMRIDNCTGANKLDSSGGGLCAKCPSLNYNRSSFNDESTLVHIPVSQSSFVRCQRPDFYETLSDLFGGVSEDLLSIIKDSLGGFSWFVQKIPLIIFIAVIVTIIIIVFNILSKFYNNKKSNSQNGIDTDSLARISLTKSIYT